MSYEEPYVPPFDYEQWAIDNDDIVDNWKREWFSDNADVLETFLTRSQMGHVDAGRRRIELGNEWLQWRNAKIDECVGRRMIGMVY